MKDKIYLASPHMSDEGYEQRYVKAFDIVTCNKL